MATHGPCETEGPGPPKLLARPYPSGIRDISGREQGLQRQFPSQGSRITSGRRCRTRPGDNGPPPDRQVTVSLHIV